MKTKGLTLYCSDPEHLRPAEDSSELSKQTRAAGIALAAHCSVAAAFNFMKKENAEIFSRSMGDSTRTEMRQLNAIPPTDRRSASKCGDAISLRTDRSGSSWTITGTGRSTHRSWTTQFAHCCRRVSATVNAWSLISAPCPNQTRFRRRSGPASMAWR